MSAQSGSPAPFGVKLIAFLYYIGAAIIVLWGIFRLMAPAQQASTAMLAFLPGQSAGIVAIGLGLFWFFLGNGMSSGAPWARVVALVVNGIAILAAINNLAAEDSMYWKVELGVAIAVSLYLAFSNSVSEHFRRG